MLIEIWERLRGYDKWIQTEATIKSSKLAEVEVARLGQNYGEQVVEEWQSDCVIEWTDESGNSHSAGY